MPREHHRERAGRPRRRIALIAALAAAVLVVVAGIAVVATLAARSAYDDAAAALAGERAAAADAVDRAQRALAAAEAVVAESEDAGGDPERHGDLAAAIAEFEPLLAEAEAEVAGSARLLDDAEPGSFALGFGARGAAVALSDADFSAASALPAQTDALEAATDAVAAEIEEWLALAGASAHTEHVHASGWYPELDECLGSVDLTERYDGVPVIAEHWSCGGKDFPDEPGTIVTLTGVHEGIYRVEGIVATLDSERHGVSDLPRGHELMYQTCQDGWSWQMSFTALERIG